MALMLFNSSVLLLLLSTLLGCSHSGLRTFKALLSLCLNQRSLLACLVNGLRCLNGHVSDHCRCKGWVNSRVQGALIHELVILLIVERAAIIIVQALLMHHLPGVWFDSFH